MIGYLTGTTTCVVAKPLVKLKTVCYMYDYKGPKWHIFPYLNGGAVLKLSIKKFKTFSRPKKLEGSKFCSEVF